LRLVVKGHDCLERHKLSFGESSASSRDVIRGPAKTEGLVRIRVIAAKLGNLFFMHLSRPAPEVVMDTKHQFPVDGRSFHEE
jgi:hypothetical protein